MIDWTYKELKESVLEDLVDFENDEECNYSPEQVAGRCFYENTVVISDGYTESIIIHIVIGKYIIKRCTREFIREYVDKLKTAFKDYDRGKIDESLTQEEIEEIEGGIKDILETIEKFE